MKRIHLVLISMLIVFGCKTNQEIIGEYIIAYSEDDDTKNKLMLNIDSTFIYTVDNTPFVSDTIYGTWCKANKRTLKINTKCDKTIEKKIDYVFGDLKGFFLQVNYVSENIESNIFDDYECFVFCADTTMVVSSDEYGGVYFSDKYGVVDSIFISSYHQTQSVLEAVIIPSEYKAFIDSIKVQIPLVYSPCINGGQFYIKNDSVLIIK